MKYLTSFRSRKMNETIVDLIRHGEPVGGRAYRGHSINDPLSDRGWQQMWDAVGDHAPWQQIISSPLQRCLAFAEALADKHGLPCNLEEGFKEVGFGSWEGRTPDEIQSEQPAAYRAFYKDPANCRPEGAEPLEAFVTRVISAYENLLQDFTGQHLLVVAHAGVIRAIVAHTLNAGTEGLYRLKIDTAGLSRITHSDKGAILDFHNKPKLI
jgi:alpha-ribazole phosphatase